MESRATGEDAVAVRRALDWFMEGLSAEEWSRRKNAIEDYLEAVHAPYLSREAAPAPAPLSTYTDKMGWYLYLAETALTRVESYEPTQGARVLPIFHRLGTDLGLLTTIGDIEGKRARLLTIDADAPDSGLFEMLVALLWRRNDWCDVDFVPATPASKSHDLIARAGKLEWAIECKRLAKDSEYSLAERAKWLRMWRQLSHYLVDRRMAVVLEIVFHVPLETLDDNFLLSELGGKLPLIVSPCTIISNETWEVSVSGVDMAAAHRHLQHNFVKCPSEQLNELIAGYRDANRGFTSIVGGKMGRIGGGRGNNRYLDSLDFAAGAFWHCDADSVIDRKARDIRGRLAKAVAQLPDGVPSVVHVGLETLDGVLVEAERYGRIFRTVSQFDPRGKDLGWVYCHLYQSYSPPDVAWTFDETVYYFSSPVTSHERPLEHMLTVVPKGATEVEGLHWLKETP